MVLCSPSPNYPPSLLTSQAGELQKIHSLKSSIADADADADKTAMSAKTEALAKSLAADLAEKQYVWETRILQLRGEGTTKSTKLADEADRELRIMQAKKTLLDTTNVSAQTALNMATARVNAEDAGNKPEDGPRRKEPKPRKNHTSGYSNVQRLMQNAQRGAFPGLDNNSFPGLDAFDALQRKKPISEASGRGFGEVPPELRGRTEFGSVPAHLASDKKFLQPPMPPPMNAKAAQNMQEKQAPKGDSTMGQLLQEIQKLNATMTSAVGG